MFVQRILALVADHPHAAYLAIFLSTMAELLVRADQSVYHFLQSIRTPWGDHIMVAITELGGGVVALLTLAAVGTWDVALRHG